MISMSNDLGLRVTNNKKVLAKKIDQIEDNITV